MVSKSKMVAATSAIAAASLLAACSSTPAAPSTTAAASTSAPAIGKIVYIPGLTGNPFYNTVACGASAEAAKSGVPFSYQGTPNWDTAAQISLINAVVATKPGAIMISITDPVALDGPLTAAKAAGIKIIAIDGDLVDKSVMSTNIQADGFTAAQLAGEALAKAVGYKGDVLAVDNQTGSIVAKARTDGFASVIAKYPNMKFLGIEYSANDVSKAASIVSTSATNDPNLVGVFGAETNNTAGALTGVRESNKVGKVHVVGFDTSDPIVAALKAGTLDGTVVQFPRGEGVLGVQAAISVMNGNSVPRNQVAPAIFVTPATVNTSAAQQYIYDVNCKMS